MCSFFVILGIESCLECCVLFCAVVIVLYCIVLYCPVLHCCTLPPGINPFAVNNNNNNNNNNNSNNVQQKPLMQLRIWQELLLFTKKKSFINHTGRSHGQVHKPPRVSLQWPPCYLLTPSLLLRQLLQLWRLQKTQGTNLMTLSQAHWDIQMEYSPD